MYIYTLTIFNYILLKPYISKSEKLCLSYSELDFHCDREEKRL